MPHGSQVAASQSPWRVLVVGPDTDAPRLISTLKLIDPEVSIDRVSTSQTAERCLRAPVSYDVAFILDSMSFDTGEPAGELIEHLSVGRHPPPLVVVRTAADSRAFDQLEGHVPVTVDVETINVRRLIRSVRAARDLQRLERLGHLLDTMPARLRPDPGGYLHGIDPVLDELVDALDVVGAHLTLSSDDDEVGWQLTAGNALDAPERRADDPGSIVSGGIVSSPILTVQRRSLGFGAVLRLGPLPPQTQNRLRDDLAEFLDLILDRLHESASRRAPGADREPTGGHSESDQFGDAHPTLTVPLLGRALPTLESDTLEALGRLDFAIMHQPIATASGAIIESDMLLGVRVPGVSNAPPRYEVVDLSVLDSLDTAAARTITDTFTVPTGHWLIATAMPALRRLIDSGDLEPDHRIHLSLLHRQLADRATVDQLSDLISGYQIDPSSLAIDVAEPTLLEHHDTISAMYRLAGLGVSLFLDGFGGAGSNFTLLRTPLLRGVRLSNRVVRGVSSDQRQASILSGLIALCSELELEVIATGVDHPADFAWLNEYGHINVSGKVVGQALTEEQLLGQPIS